jgi:isoleucyl-tRNA synthetase
VDEVYKKLIQKVYNVLSFYELYPTDGEGRPTPTVLDSWILSRLGELNVVITESLNAYEIDKAVRPIMDFVDDLSTWYLRRSRERFKSEDKAAKFSASFYMAYVLREFSKLAAPFLPFLAEEVYRRVPSKDTPHAESVHLESWPLAQEVDKALLSNMQKVRDIVTEALESRQKAGLKVRQPIASLTIAESLPEEFLNIIAEEINVKEVRVGAEFALDTNLTTALKEEGIARDVIRAIQDTRKTEKLNPGDKIKIVFHANEDVKKIIEAFQDMIKSPTGVTEIGFEEGVQTHRVVLDDGEVSLSILK